MPRYYRDHPRGYDLDRELRFITIHGEPCLVGTADSIVLCCPVCAAQHFRMDPTVYADWTSQETCFDGHGRLEAQKLSELDSKWRPLYERLGITMTTAEERKARRLAEEAERPWNWVFGEKAEADFPDGYVKVA